MKPITRQKFIGKEIITLNIFGWWRSWNSRLEFKYTEETKGEKTEEE